MLQTQIDSSRLGLGSPEGPLPGNDAGIGPLLFFIRGFLQRQYPIIVFVAALGLSGAFMYLHVTPPVYTAHVQVLLANPKAQFVQQESILAEPAFDRGYLDTQLQIINSPTIANIVINQLHLGPELTSGSGSPFGSMLGRVRAWLGKPADKAPETRADQITEAFLKRLTATRIEMTNVIDLSLNWNDPSRAAEVANAIAKAYIDDQLNAKFEANRTAALWLQQRIQQLGDQADAAERAVNAYKTQHNIVQSDGKSIDDQQITELSSRLVAARAQAADLKARVDRYDSILKQAPADSDSIGTLDAAGSDVLSSPIITNLRQQYLELARRESEYSARFGANHLSVVNLRTRMHELRSSIFDEVRRLGETTRSDYNVALQRQEDLEKQLAQAVSQSRATNSAEVTLRELDGKAKSYRTLYATFLQRYTGAAQQETFPISEARVIYPAFPPQQKSKPKTTLILALALFGGIGFGAGLGFLREMLDRVFRTPDQIEAALGLPCLSVVPLLKAANLKDAKGVERASLHNSSPDSRTRTVSTASASHWGVLNMPLSRFAEAIRSIKLGVDLRALQNSNRVIGITSSLPHEGKSTISASLAQLIAQAGKTVVLVDCDLRNPSLSAALAPNAKIGLLDVISGAHSLNDSIWKEPKTNLAFLPGVKRPLLHSSEILMTEQMRKLFERLRAAYDYVIVDLPPLSPIVDVRASVPLVDSFVLIVEWAATKIDVVQHALHTAPNVYENLAGVVLNKADMKSMARYNSYLKDYYNDDHYIHYGLTDAD